MKLKKFITIGSMVLSLSSIAFAKGPSGKRKPPKAAHEACSSLKLDDTCTFVGKKQTSVTGKCVQRDTAKPLVCKPNNHSKESRAESSK